MVVGLDKFKAHFAGYDAQFVLIGGAACEVLMDQAALEFRATKDLDIVLCVEALDTGFAKRFWEFVVAGGYEQRERGSGARQFYRFVRPTDPTFPKMLELFARKPETIELLPDSYLTPIPVEEEVVSLSAILLDDDYYELLKSGIVVVDGLPVAQAAVLIPLKCSAYLNLAESKAAGTKVDSKDIAKHRNDVFRLLQLFPADERLAVPEKIKSRMTEFVEDVAKDNAFSPKSIGLPGDASDQTMRLRSVYGL